MSLKRVIHKNTWYITGMFLAFSVAASLCMVSVAKRVEQMISRLEAARADSFLGAYCGNWYFVRVVCDF